MADEPKTQSTDDTGKANSEKSSVAQNTGAGDSPKPTSQAASSEVTATDLLSLWGGGSTTKPASSVSPAPAPKVVPSPAAPAPSAPTPVPPVAPESTPTVAPQPPSPAAPNARPTSPPLPQPPPAPPKPSIFSPAPAPEVNSPRQTAAAPPALVRTTTSAPPSPALQHPSQPQLGRTPVPQFPSKPPEPVEPRPPMPQKDLPWQTSKTPPPVQHGTRPHTPPARPTNTMPPTAPPRPRTEPDSKFEQEEIKRPEPQQKKEKKLESQVPKPIPKPQILEGQLVGENSEQEFLPEDEDGDSPIKDFLRDINISKKSIFFGIGCIVVVIVLIIVGVFVFRFIRNRTSNPPVTVPPTQTEVPSETGIPSSSTIGGSAFISPRHIQSTGLEVTSALGAEPESMSGMTSYLDSFKRMQNAYATNIKELLNKSVDRRARLESYLVLLRTLDSDGRAIQAEITARMITLQNDYNSNLQNRQVLDQQFFVQVDQFNGPASEKTLLNFIQVSRNLIETRSEYKALQKIRAFFDRGLPRLEARIRDIELNKDALVEGITVYEVEGSDLNLIVPVATGVPESFESTSSFPVMNPTAGSETDFITQPGGGFAPVPQPVPQAIQPETDFITQPGGGFAPVPQTAPQVIQPTY